MTNGYNFWYIEADGKSTEKNYSLVLNDLQAKVFLLAMANGKSGTEYDSFEDYWATIAPNQFWVEY